MCLALDKYCTLLGADPTVNLTAFVSSTAVPSLEGCSQPPAAFLMVGPLFPYYCVPPLYASGPTRALTTLTLLLLQGAEGTEGSAVHIGLIASPWPFLVSARRHCLAGAATLRLSALAAQHILCSASCRIWRRPSSVASQLHGHETTWRSRHMAAPPCCHDSARDSWSRGRAWARTALPSSRKRRPDRVLVHSVAPPSRRLSPPAAIRPPERIAVL